MNTNVFNKNNQHEIMNKKKSQVAIEFLVLILFGFVVISLIIYGMSIYIIDLKEQQERQRIDDIAQSILEEFEVAQETQNGFSRTIEIESYIINQYNITLNHSTGYLILQDTYGTNPQQKHYYVIEGLTNFTYEINDSSSQGEIKLIATNTSNYDGLNLR